MRFIIWLLLPLFLFGESSEKGDEALFLRRIADFWQEGDYTLAKSQMEEFITTYPESSFTDVLSAALGDLLFREKNWSAALDKYSLVRNEEIAEKIFLNRMQCLYEMQWFATLVEQCETYLQKTPNINVTYFLSLGLYHQSLNAAKDPDMLAYLANKARPHFETLLQSPLSDEVALGFAHLCCIVKDYPKAVAIYTQMAQKSTDNKEELLFQVALLQAEYDKTLAITTFDQIANMGQKRAKEARYNQVVLSFELGQYEEITKKRNLLNEIPADRVSLAHLFLGQSLIALKKYDSAIVELQEHLRSAATTDSARSALLSLVDAAFHCNDIATLDQAIAKIDLTDPELPKIYFSRAQVLKKQGKTDDAVKQLEQIVNLFPSFPQKAQVTFELCHLEFQTQLWNNCYKHAALFLQSFPSHEFTPFVWQHLLHSVTQLAVTEEAKNDFAHKMEKLAIETAAINNPDVQLLLFNAYVQLEKKEQAAEHLYQALLGHQEISRENHIWLADFYINQSETKRPFAEKACVILERMQGEYPKKYMLGKMYLLLDKLEEAKRELEKFPATNGEAQFLLAECYLKQGNKEQASALLEALVKASPTLQAKSAAMAAFQLAKLQHAQNIDILPTLKQLMAQKNIMNEPIHLEAALLFADITAEGNKEKLKELLISIKSDFEKCDDLLSRDYHATRATNAKQNQIYTAYLQYMDTVILSFSKDPETQKEVSIKSENLLQELIKDPIPLLMHRLNGT